MARAWCGLAALSLMLGGCLGAPAEPPATATAAPSNPFLVPGDQLLLQVDAVPGREPSAFALDALVATAGDVGSRVGHVVASSLVADGPYDDEELLALHAATYSADPTTWRNATGIPVLHVLYVDGAYENDLGLDPAGLSFHGVPLIIVFPDRFPGSVRSVVPVPDPSPLGPGYERSVLIHEYGHQLGLVGCGLLEVHPRQDPESDCHSSESDSVMYASMHNADPVEWVRDDELQTVWRFNGNDWLDIRAYQDALGKP